MNGQQDKQLIETVRELVKVQKTNNAVKEKELSIEQERIKSNEKIALASISAQKEDRFAQMSIISKFEIAKYIIIFTIIIVVTIVVWHSMGTGNTDFIIELAKMLIPLIAGCFGGYGYGRYKSVAEKTDSDN